MVTRALIVCGGRDYSDRAHVFATLDRLHAEVPIALVIEGGAHGADALAKAWAYDRRVYCHTFPADWTAHGKRAGAIRNAQMLRSLLAKPEHGYTIAVVAFPGGRGTADMVRRARAAGVEVLQP